ncbi:MAG: hypothetical protein IJ153_03920 [Clostridia bacterium]|nr:hypothetical protein [Clostridia bacterium]
MLNSTSRKLALAGWLHVNAPDAYNNSLRLQKFLFLYEALCKAEGKEYEFSHLKGYERGPVFSTVWGDYTKEQEAFNIASRKQFEKLGDKIDAENAIKMAFIVKTSTDNELSELTHQFDIWKKQEPRIVAKEKQVELLDSDFQERDVQLITLLGNMYDVDQIIDSAIVHCNNKYYVFSTEDAKRLTEQHYDDLYKLSDNDDLINPVFTEIDSEGVLTFVD